MTVQSAQEFLEKNYSENLTSDEAVMLSIKALVEVMEVSAKNIEVAVLLPSGLRILQEDELEEVLKRLDESKGAQ